MREILDTLEPRSATDLWDLVEQALLGAIPDNRISASDFEDYAAMKKEFKRRRRKAERRMFRAIESEGLDLDGDDAMLGLILLRRLR